MKHLHGMRSLFIRFLILFFVAVVCTLAATAQRAVDMRHSRVRVFPASQAEHMLLRSLDVDHMHADGEGIVAVLTHEDVRTLDAAGVRVEVLVRDLEHYYADRAEADLAAGAQPLMQSSVPANFTLGSVGGHLSPDEIHQQLLRMAELYPHLVSSPQQIGTSHEGRPIVAVRLSSTQQDDALVPEVLYTALHHAREPTGMMSLFYTMWSLLEGYGADAESTYLLDNRALWFIPLVNPDGYAYNVAGFPFGGGLWRKNMRAQGDSAVDLNRNYGPEHFWNHEAGGSSTNRNADNYRGSAPFSEPETQAIRDFCLRRRFDVALNHHTFSNLFIQPQEIVDLTPQDSVYYTRATRALGSLAAYAPGSSKITVGYATRGTSDDWMYAYGRGAEGHIYSWTPESGNGDDAFWPLPSRVAPISAWNHRMNVGIAWAAGAAPMITRRGWRSSASGPVARITVMNVGRRPMTQQATLALEGGSSTNIPVMSPGEALDFELAVGDSLRMHSSQSRQTLEITLAYDGVALRDSIMPIMRDVDTLFADDFETGFGRWKTGIEWGEERVDGSTVASDSPYRNYTERRGVENTLELAELISLAGYDAAELAFDASYVVEARSHNAGVQVLRGESLLWEDVDAVELQLPFDTDAITRSRFRGDGSPWRRYRVRLDGFVGDDISVRFFVSAPTSQFHYTFDGVKVDNVEVIASRMPRTAVDTDTASRMSVSPNPFSSTLSVELAGAGQSAIELYDALGELVAWASARSHARLDTEHLAPGAYTLVVRTGELVARRRVLLVR